MNRFQENGIAAQERARTIPEAVKAMNWSCEKCNVYACNRCPILGAHEFRKSTIRILSEVERQTKP